MELAELQARGACAGSGDARAFSRTGWRTFAEEFCGRCEVREECLDFALRVPQSMDYGVWGGLTREERRKLRMARGVEPDVRAWGLDYLLGLVAREQCGTNARYQDARCRCDRCCAASLAYDRERDDRGRLPSSGIGPGG